MLSEFAEGEGWGYVYKRKRALAAAIVAFLPPRVKGVGRAA